MTFADWGVVAALIIAVPVVIAVIWAIIRGTKHLTLVHEAIAGREATAVSEAIPSMIERFQAVKLQLNNQDDDIAYIKGELSYNGGGTTKDQVRKTTRKVDALMSGQAAALTREGQIAKTAVDTADALHTETEDIAANVAGLAVDTAAELRLSR